MATGNEKLQLDITAKDDASKTVDALQKKVAKLESTDTTVEVDADTREAEKGLQSVSKAADKLDSQDATLEVGANVRQVLGALDDVASEVIRTKAVADTLGNALGPELAAKADTVRVVGELKAMGLSLEDIEANADQLGAKLKDLADADVGGKLGGSLGTARGKIDEMSDSARGANSALANMVGNTTQDIAGLGGIVGSLGVGLGQMGEYAADAALDSESLGSALTSMAKVAGPMAALAAATYLVGNAIKTVQTRDALKADQVKAFTEAMRDGDDAVTAFADHLREVGKIEIPELAGWGSDILGLGDGVENVTQLLDKFNLKADEFASIAVGGEDAIKAWSDAQLASGAKGSEVLKVVTALTTAHAAYTEGQIQAKIANEVFGDSSKEVAKRQEQAKKAFEGGFDALKTWTEQIGEAVAGQQAFDAAVEGEDWGVAGLDAAVSAMSDFTAAHNGLIDINSDAQAAYDDFSETIKRNAKGIEDHTKVFDVSTAAGRDNQKALEDVAKTLDVKLAAAYKDSGGDMEVFQDKAKGISDEALFTLMPALEGSGISVEDLAEKLGLLPEDIETRYKLAGDAEAKAKIGLLQGAIDHLPKDVQTQVTQKIIVGDYQGALAIVQNYYSRNPADMATEARPPSIGSLLGAGLAVSNHYANNPVPIATRAVAPGNLSNIGKIFKATGGVVGPGGGIGGEAGPEIIERNGVRALIDGPTGLAPGTKVTSTTETARLLRATGSGGDGGVGGPSVNLIVQGSINGDAHLRAVIDSAMSRLAGALAAGRR